MALSLLQYHSQRTSSLTDTPPRKLCDVYTTNDSRSVSEKRWYSDREEAKDNSRPARPRSLTGTTSARRTTVYRMTARVWTNRSLEGTARSERSKLSNSISRQPSPRDCISKSQVQNQDVSGGPVTKSFDPIQDKYIKYHGTKKRIYRTSKVKSNGR